MKIGLIGCGAIGQFLLKTINEERRLGESKIVTVFDERESSLEKIQHLAERYSFQHENHLQSFLTSPIDIVVECANVASVNKYAKEIVKWKNLLSVSVGAFVDLKKFQQLEELARAHRTKIYLPTGAIGGLDLIKSANSLGGLEKVTLITKKPIAAFHNKKNAEKQVIFEGTAKEEIARYPKNINVSIAIALAGIGIEKTIVQMIADPTVSKNSHTIQIEGDFGRAKIMIENNPSPANPKTSYLTSLSILSALQSIKKQIVIGAS